MLEKIKKILKSKYQENLNTIRINLGLHLRNKKGKTNILEKLSNIQFKVFFQFEDDVIIS
jgi:hypothetical protein